MLLDAMLLDAITAPAFRALSRLRRARTFHPRGVAYEATWMPSPDSPLPTEDPLRIGERTALVRVSRGAGLPSPLPDILGVAVKVLDVHGPGRDQDLLLASVASDGMASWLLAPATTFADTVFSTVLPYDVNGFRTAVVADVQGEPSTSVDGPDLAVEIDIELSLEDPDAQLATVTLTRRVSADVARDLRFDPWHTGASLQPTGRLNRLRRPAYEASQEGRDAPMSGVRHRL